MLVLNLPFKALMFLTLMRPSLVLFLVLWLKLVKDFLKVRCRLALLPFLISCLIWLDLVRSEERRVGKECRMRWWEAEHKKKAKNRSDLAEARSEVIRITQALAAARAARWATGNACDPS